MSEQSTFLLNSRAKIAQLSAIITEQQRDSDEGYMDNVRLRKELIVFNRTLNNTYLDWTPAEIKKAIHYYNVKASLNKVPYLELGSFEPFIIGTDSGVPPGGPFATELELQNEVSQRQAADAIVQAQIETLQTELGNIDLSLILPVGFLDDVAYKTDLHSHDNKAVLDDVTQAHIDLLLLYNAHIINSSHITSAERTRWEAKVATNDPRLSDARTPLAHTHGTSEITGLDSIITSLNNQIAAIELESGEDGITPVLSIGDVTEGEVFSASITGEVTDLKLNIVFKPGEDGADFGIDKTGLAADRLNVLYEAELDGYTYLASDESNLYFRVSANPATDASGWSDPVPFGYKGWSPILGIYQPTATRAVVEVLGWVGGSGDEPVIPVPDGMDPDTARLFLGASGYTYFQNQAINLMPPGSGGGLSQEEVAAIIQAALEFYVIEEEGKGLSENDFTDAHITLLSLLSDTGNGDKFLADDGIYKKASASIINDAIASFSQTYSSAYINQLLDAIITGLIPKGNWDASSAVAPHATPEIGWFWIVTVAGTTVLDSVTTWDIGDYVWWNGIEWLKVPSYEKGLIGTKEVDLTNLSAGMPMLVYNDVTDVFEAAALPTGGSGASDFSELLGSPRDNAALDSELDSITSTITALIPSKATDQEHIDGNSIAKFTTPYGVQQAIKAWLGDGLVWDEVNEHISVEEILSKATTELAIAGVNDTDYMTPLKTLQSLAERSGIGITWDTVNKRFNLGGSVEDTGFSLTTFMTYANPDIWESWGFRIYKEGTVNGKAAKLEYRYYDPGEEGVTDPIDIQNWFQANEYGIYLATGKSFLLTLSQDTESHYSARINDNRTLKSGLEYSSTFPLENPDWTDRSLVHKAYVDSVAGGGGTDHTAEITALEEGKKDKYITVPTSFAPGDCIDKVGDTWTLASATVEPFFLVVESGKAITPGSTYDLGLANGIYFWNETTQSLTLTKPTEEGEVVRVAYKQATGLGLFLWDNGYIIGSSTPPTANEAPVSNAGTDDAITLPTTSIQLNGSGTDSDGTIASYAWTQQSGPNTAVFDNAAIVNPTVSGLIEGAYVFRLTVTDDDAATDFDDVTVTVSAEPIPPSILLQSINVGEIIVE